MATLADVRNSIKTSLSDNGTVYNDGLNTAIRTAIRLLESKRYWFLRKIGQVTLSVGATSVSVPTDFSMIESIDLIYSGARTTKYCGFEMHEYEPFKQMYLLTVPIPNGKPVACSLFNRTIYVSHQTQLAAALELTYYRRDTNEVTNDADVSIMFGRESLHVVRSMAKFIFENEDWNAEGKSQIVLGYQEALDRQQEVYEYGSYM
jgi:hypothetical protein